MTTVTISIDNYNKYLRNEKLVKEQAKQIRDLLKNSKSKVVIETIKRVEYVSYFDVLQNTGTTISYRFIELDDFISDIKSPYIESLKNKIEELENNINQIDTYKQTRIEQLDFELFNVKRELESCIKQSQSLILNIIEIVTSINIFNMKKRIYELAEMLDLYLKNGIFKKNINK